MGFEPSYIANAGLMDLENEILAGPVGLVPFLRDRKIAYIHMAGTSALGMKLNSKS